jgi:hypothetical protein
LPPRTVNHNYESFSILWRYSKVFLDVLKKINTEGIKSTTAVITVIRSKRSNLNKSGLNTWSELSKNIKTTNVSMRERPENRRENNINIVF